MSMGTYADLTNTYNLDIDFANIDRLIITEQLNIQSNSDQITFGDSDQVILNVDTTNIRTYQLPSVPNSDFVMTDGIQNIAGNKTFTGIVNFGPAIVQNLPVDDITIQNTGNELAVKIDGIDTLQLADGAVTDIKVSPGIDAVKIADGSVSNIEFQYLDGVQSNIQLQITDNAMDIATNAINIATNTNNIATNVIDIATNTANILTNTNNIATNVIDIATNTADILTNTNNIATNTADILTNTNNIATNTADILTNTNEIATFPVELKNLTSAEITQLENINLNTISNTQWGYLGNMNQGVATTNNASFVNLTLTGVLNSSNKTSGTLIIGGGIGCNQDIWCTHILADAVFTNEFLNLGGNLFNVGPFMRIRDGNITHKRDFDIVRTTGSVSIANNSTTDLNFGTSIYDVAGAWSSNRWNCPKTGYYSGSASVRWVQNSSGNRIVTFTKNGSTFLGGSTCPGVATNTLTQSVSFAGEFFLSTDYVSFQVYQNSGGAINVTEGRIQILCEGLDYATI